MCEIADAENIRWTPPTWPKCWLVSLRAAAAGRLARLACKLAAAAVLDFVVPGMHPSEVHLTVGVVRYESLGRWRRRGFELSGRAVAAWRRSPRLRSAVAKIPPARRSGRAGHHDRPRHGHRPLPRFFEERTRPARGKKLAVFRQPALRLDFLYNDELSGFLDTGALTKLELAFSRDTAEKVYVQDTMLEQGAELWRWIEEAHAFTSAATPGGWRPTSSRPSAPSIATHGRMSEDSARDTIKRLVAEHRYHKDVYEIAAKLPLHKPIGQFAGPVLLWQRHGDVRRSRIHHDGKKRCV